MVDSGPHSATCSATPRATLERLAVGHDAADQPDLLRLVRAHGAGGEEDVHRDGVGDLAGEPARGPAEREQAAAGLPHAEDRALARDPDVGALEHLGAAGDRVALDGGDHRLQQR